MKIIYLPYKCLLALVKQPELLKAFCIWGRLKLMTKWSAIHNIKSRKQELAKRLGISENTFRKYLSVLKAKDMVWIDESGVLRLANKYVLYKVLNIDANYAEHTGLVRDKRFRLSVDELNIDNLKLLAIQYQRKTINHNNLERVKKELLNEYGTIHSPKALKYAMTKVSKQAQFLIEKNKENPAVGYSNDSRTGFVDDNVSSQTIARLFGRKSKMTGNRFMHKMKREGVIDYNKRHIVLDKLHSYENLSLMNESSSLPLTIVKKDGENYLALRIPNEWRFRPVGMDSSSIQGKEVRTYI